MPTTATSGGEGSDFLPAAQIRLEALQMEQRIDSKFTGLDARMTSLEARMATSELNDKSLMDGQGRIIGGNDDILKQLANLTEVQHTITTETADGVQVVKTFSRWRQTADDLHLNKAAIWGSRVAGMWLVAHFVGWLFGPEIRDKVVHLVFGGGK